MTNFGLERAFAQRDVPFQRASVGDRYVLEKLHELGWQLGGENSGHIICLDKHTTGDGIVSALQVLHALRASDATLDRLVSELTLYPQVLVNVRIQRGVDPGRRPQVQAAIQSATAQTGRARPSAASSVGDRARDPGDGGRASQKTWSASWPNRLLRRSGHQERQRPTSTTEPGGPDLGGRASAPRIHLWPAVA